MTNKNSSSNNDSVSMPAGKSYGNAINAASSELASKRSRQMPVNSSRSMSFSFGYCVRSMASVDGNANGATVGMTPKRKVPVSGWRDEAQSSTKSLACATSSRARTTVASPIVVKETWRRSRSTSVTSKVLSRSRRLAESVLWVMKLFSAARPKWRSSSRAIK